MPSRSESPCSGCLAGQVGSPIEQLGNYRTAAIKARIVRHHKSYTVARTKSRFNTHSLPSRTAWIAYRSAGRQTNPRAPTAFQAAIQACCSGVTLFLPAFSSATTI